MGHRAMILLVWTFIVVSCLMDIRNLQVHSKFYLIETADGNLDSSKSQDLALDVCVDIDKTGQCSSSYKNSCHECSVARLCRKTCGLCPGDGGHGNCFDVDAEGQCDQYKDKCHNGCVAKIVRRLVEYVQVLVLLLLLHLLQLLVLMILFQSVPQLTDLCVVQTEKHTAINVS